MSDEFWISVENLILVFAFKYFERINANYLIVLTCRREDERIDGGL